MSKNITVCVDGSESSEAAFSMAVELAKGMGASLHILTVAPPSVPSYMSVPASPAGMMPDEEVVRHHTELAERFMESARQRGVEDRGFTVLKGHVVEQVLDHLEREGTDLLVVGARGLSRFQRLLLGSVSSALVQYAKTSVLVVKRPGATVASGPGAPRGRTRSRP